MASFEAFRQISVTVEAGVAVLTLARPENLNRWTTAMADEVGAALRELDADPAVRAVVLTGAGRSFCAGLDLSDPSVLEDSDARSEPTVLP